MSTDKKLIDIGTFEVESAILSTIDGSKKLSIGNLISSFNFTESIYSTYLSGQIVIYDNHALIDEFPIKGGETVTLKINDYFENSFEYKFSIYAIDEINTDNKSESQVYALRLISPDFFLSESIIIRQSFRGTTSQIAESIFKKHFVENNKKLSLENTDNMMALVIPAYTPVETMLFLARKSFSTTNKSSNFLFFENRKEYVFKTHESLFSEDIPDRRKFYYGEPKLDIKERKQLMNIAIRMSIKKRFNSIEEMRTGAQKTEIWKIDGATKSFNMETYEYIEGEFKHTDSNIKPHNTDSYKSKYASNGTSTYITFEDSASENQKYSDIIPRRNSSNFYLGKTILELVVHGANDIFAGDMIELNIAEMKFVNGDKQLHPNLSGKYMIESIIHSMEGKKWEMRMRIIKDGDKK